MRDDDPRNDDETKHCPKCGHTKPHAEFHLDAARTDGLSSYCAECVRAENRTPRARNRPSNVVKWTDWTFKHLKLNGRDY